MANPDDPTLPLPGSTPPVLPGDTEPEEMAPGARAGPWELVRLLARGGHGTVYVAVHKEDGRRAAVKILSRAFGNSPEMAGRFVREARILSRLRHPGVVDIHELGILTDGRPFVAMELLDGKSLLDVLAGRGRLPLAEVVEILSPVCVALEAAHRAGVIHRDVKASNVLVTPGDPPSVKLIDFGVARATGPEDPSLTTAGQRLGSAHAMAPELIRGGAADPRADVYALGVLLYQLLTGELPFWSEDGFELERLHLTAPPPRPGRLAPVPAAVDGVVERALAKRPDDRFSSAAAFLEALRAAAGFAGRAEERTARAVAVHVTFVPSLDLDEECAIRLALLEDDAAERLAAASLEVDVRAGGVLLATRLLPTGTGGARAVRGEVLAAAATLQRELAAAAGDAGHVEVCVHAGEVRIVPGGRRTGGSLFRTTAWVRPAPEGFLATDEALEGLGGAS
jgi:eukaryotic-like serine/threonine-protein kinase